MNIQESLRVGLHITRLTKKEVAEELGVTIQSVYNWARGGALPSLQTVEQLAQLFDVPVSTFIEWGEEE